MGGGIANEWHVYGNIEQSQILHAAMQPCKYLYQHLAIEEDRFGVVTGSQYRKVHAAMQPWTGVKKY